MHTDHATPPSVPQRRDRPQWRETFWGGRHSAPTRNAPTRNALLLTALLLIAPLLLAGCDWTVGPEPGQGEPPAPVTVTEVRAEPQSPVSPGDEVVFTAVTPDTAAARIQYRWFLDGVPRTLVTDTASVTWTAPSKARTYRHAVVTVLTADTAQTASREFSIRVEVAPRPPESVAP